MKNLLAEKKLTVTQIVVAIWILFSVIYVAQDLWRDGLAAAYNSGQQAGAQIGVANFINQAMTEAQKCEEIVLTNGQAQMGMVATQCLQKQEGAEDAQ